MTLPAGFVWGAATAAYQIEGAVREDGRAPSIWDTFSHTPGKVLGSDNGDVACEHYHRYPDDVALMAELGLAAYRFSTSWSRILPTGTGKPNQAGLDFYSRLVDELLAKNITPYVTLYHWDLPQALEDAGGWVNRDTADRLGDLAAVVALTLGDRVLSFTTLNEPFCSAFLGYANGKHAPGLEDPALALAAAHHLNLGHGLAVATVRDAVPGAQVSITLNPHLVRPATGSEEDRDAALRTDRLANGIFLDPLFRGEYSPALQKDTAAISDWSFVREGDLEVIAAPIDFLGVNYYEPAWIGLARSPEDELWPGLADVALRRPAGPKTGQGWCVEPAGLTELLKYLAREYTSLPMMITENGCAFDDVVLESGDVDDVERTEYVLSHIAAAADAVAAGVDVRGYFAWSLLDNFEWAWGYSQRFGIVHVDFETQARRPKRSALAYRNLIAKHGDST